MTPRILYAHEPVSGWLPWGLLVLLLGFTFVLVPVIGVSLLLKSLGLLEGDDGGGVPGLLAFLVLGFSLVALLTGLWVRFVERRPLATIGLVGAQRVRNFLRGHAIGMASLLLVVCVIAVFGGYRVGDAPPFDALRSLHGLGGLLLLGLAFALQSSVEEIVFRGWLLSTLARKFNLWLAVLLSSVVFTLLHYSPTQHLLAPLGTFAFALFACCWAIKANHIWGVMGWHAGWNWLLSTGFALPLSGTPPIKLVLLVPLVDAGPPFLTGGIYGPEASIVALVLLALASAAVLAWRRASPAVAVSRV